MSIPSLADRVRANQPTRSPVQDTVRTLFQEISDARASGTPWRKIHAQLTREGYIVGANHSSLFTAFKQVKGDRSDAEEGNHLLKPTTHSVTSMAMPPISNAPSNMPETIIDSRRKLTNWGERS